MLLPNDVATLSRLQFGATAMFHFIFVPLTLGLSWLLVIMEAAYVMTRQVIYRDMTKFWGKLFGINFVMGVTTGLTLEFQFGTNWAYYSHYVGDIFGTPLAVEGLMAFFLESTLVGLFFFGWERLAPRKHLLVTALVALGSNLSALWILVANGWMQHPVGAQFNPVTSRMELTDIVAVLINPMAQVKFVHTVTAGYVAASLFVLGVSAWYLLRQRDIEFAKRSFATAAGFGCAAIFFLMLLGDESGIEVGKTQPTKLAAIEAEWQTDEAPAAFTLFGFPDQQQQTTHLAIKIPYAMGIIATRSLHTPVTGLIDLQRESEQRIRHGMLAYQALEDLQRGDNSANALFQQYQQDLGYGLLLTPYTAKITDASESQVKQAARDTLPQVAPLFWAFRLMVVCAAVMTALLALALWSTLRNQLTTRRWLLRALTYAIPLPWIAIEAGWFVAEFGRQPWTITHILPTVASVSNLTVSQLQFSLLTIGVIYTSLLLIEMGLMRHIIRLGPASLHTGRYHNETTR